MAPSQQSSRDGQIFETLMQHERTKQIICKVYKHLDEIIGTDKLKLVIDCAGRHVRLVRTLHDDD